MKKLTGIEMLKNAFKPKHKKNWIAGAIKKPGALHAEMGIAQGKKIPAGKLAAAAKKGGKLGARARLAETLKGFHHKNEEKGETKKDNEKAETKKKKMIETPKSSMIKEHEELVKDLKSGDKSALKREAKKQGEELDSYRKMKKRAKKHCNK